MQPVKFVQILILHQKSILTSCTGNFRRLYHSAIVKRSQKRSKSWARLQIADELLRFIAAQTPRPHEFSTLFMMMSVWSRTGPKSWKAIGSAYGLCQLVVTDVTSQTRVRADPANQQNIGAHTRARVTCTIEFFEYREH